MVVFFSCGSDEKIITPESILSEEAVMLENLKSYPDSTLLRENAIQFYRDKGDYTKALKFSEEALQRDSLNPRWYQINGILKFEAEDTVGAIRSYEHAAQLLPAPEILNALAIMYAQTKNEAALHIANEFLKTTPPLELDANFIKGVYYSYTNNSKEAHRYFDICIKMNHTFMDVYREKALLYYVDGEYQASLDLLNKAVTLQNGFDIGHYLMGKNYEKLNEKEKAIEAYQRALLYDAEYFEAREALEKLQPTNR